MLNQAVGQMLARYNCRNENDYVNAVREIMQEIVLLGLWRGKFFEHAAFYGGTALRILYGLNRGSEALDFSLLRPDPEFRLPDYGNALKRELAGFGFQVDFSIKEKTGDSRIDSAFLKANTRMLLIAVGLPGQLTGQIHSRKELKIKLEIDIDPPPEFQTEIKTLLRPIPHTVRVYALPDLLAGKLHAVLFRKWKNRSKGRDWYDLVWYSANYPKVNIRHLEQRMRQSGDYTSSNELTICELRKLLEQAVEQADISQLKADVRPFIRDQGELDLWSGDFFREVTARITD